MRAGFHTVQLNQTIRGVRVKILRSEYPAFLTFFFLVLLVLNQCPAMLFIIGCNFCRLCWVLQASVSWQQCLQRQNCVLNSLEQGINHNINLFVEHSMHF